MFTNYFYIYIYIFFYIFQNSNVQKVAITIPPPSVAGVQPISTPNLPGTVLKVFRNISLKSIEKKFSNEFSCTFFVAFALLNAYDLCVSVLV